MSKDKEDLGHLDRKELQEKEDRIIESSTELLNELSQPREGLRVPRQKAIGDENGQDLDDAINLDIDELQGLLDRINEQLNEIEPLEQALQEQKVKTLNKEKQLDLLVTNLQKVGEQAQQEAVKSEEFPLEYYLQWEPFTLMERIRSFVSNTYEIWYVLYMIIASVIYPSLSGTIMLVAVAPLMSTMTCSPDKRYFRGLIIMIIQVVAYLILVVIRLTLKKNVKETCTEDEYEKQRRRFEFVGLDVNATASGPLNDGSGNYHFELVASIPWLKYCMTGVGFIISFIFIWTQQRKIAFLIGNDVQVWNDLPSPLHPDHKNMAAQKEKKESMTTTVRKDIEYYREIKRSIENQVDNALDAGIGTKAVVDRDQKDREDKELAHKRLLDKKIPKNYIDSTHYYSWNSIFFTCTIIFQLMGAMACNSASDLPSIIFILLLGSLYPWRKTMILYRKMCFYCIYWIVTILLFKLIFSNILRMSFIQEALKGQVEAGSFFTDFLVVFFGGIPRDRSKNHEMNEEEKQLADQMLKQKILYYLCLFCGFAWKSCKWIEIRMMTADLPESSNFLARWNTYFDYRANRDKNPSVKMSYMREKMDVKKLQESIQKMKKSKNPNKLKTKTSKMRKPVGQYGKTDYLPELVLWTSRILMFCFSYTYHTYGSLVNIVWIALTFIFPNELVYLFSAVVMLPIIFIQFLLVYGIRMPIIKERPFFINYGGYYIFDMASDITEQSMMYIVLLCFFMYPSCYALVALGDQKNKMLAFFEKRCLDPKFSNVWKYIFFSMRRIQSLMLMFLFIRGFSQSINNLQNLGYMIFFVVYTAYEEIYRKTSQLLCLFTAFFIVMQYYGSLRWQLDQDYVTGQYDAAKWKSETWANIIPFANTHKTDPYYQRFELNGICKWARAHNQMYCEFKPYWMDWVILLFMGFLQSVNGMYKDRVGVAELERKVTEKIREKNSKGIYYLNRSWKVAQMIFGIGIQILLIGLISYIQINVINWIFFIQTTLLVALKLRASTSFHALTESFRVAQSIKLYSLIVLISNIMFICFVGYSPVDNTQGPNLYLKEKYPRIYENLGLIGFRSNIVYDINTVEGLEEQKHHLKITYITYVTYFLVSIYVCDRLDSMRQTSRQESEFTEEDYKRLFEAVESPDAKLNVNQNEGKEKFQSIYIKRQQWSHEQLEEFYEGVRFTIPFILYRRMNLWPIFDAFAQYGHLINNGCIVIASISYSVSLFTFFQICCVCTFYCLATLRINWTSRKGFKGSGIQTQCDIKMVQMITKKYKIDSFNIFLDLRKKIARVQFITLLLFIWLSFPTAILQQFRDESATEEQKERIENTSFWLFIIGIYKDIRPDSAKYYQNLLIMLSVGIIAEKMAIGWLKNRNGCTHYRLQKFMELDMRREALRKPQWDFEWLKNLNKEEDSKDQENISQSSKGSKGEEKKADVSLPAYDIQRYRQHYFLNDFDWLLYKIMGEMKDPKLSKDMKGESYYVKQPTDMLASISKGKHFGDFVPYKSAIRMKDMIYFSVKFDCGSNETRKETTDKDLQLLRQKDYDYEEVSVLRKFKIQQLEKIISSAIDLKYKVSLAKGAQMFLEVFMISLCMLSCIMKSNLWSWMYIIFIIRSVTTKQKTNLLVSMNTYIAILFVVQYACFLLNLSSSTSPGPFPDGFKNHPKHNDNEDDLSIEKPIPFFFHYDVFRDLTTSYSIGLGIDKDQLAILFIDFINLYTINVYTLTYKNPILRKEMRKVFWQFPTPDNTEQWNRLDKIVQKQVAWLFDPIPLQANASEKYSKETSNYTETTLSNQRSQVKHSQRQYEFAKSYNKQNKRDLNDQLTTYVDLKYQDIWAEETLKKIKNQFKNNSTYFRLVKQGSMLVYITFHIITIAVILIASALRQSFLGLFYAIMLLPRFKDGAEVLNQRAMAQQKKLKAYRELEQQLQHQLKTAVQQEELDDLKEQLQEVQQLLDKMQASARFTTVKEKEHQEKLEKQLSKGWPMIRAVKFWLLIYGLIDFCLQMYFQMPRFALIAGLEKDQLQEAGIEGNTGDFVDTKTILSHIGLKKVWVINHPMDLDYKDMINSGYDRRVGMEFNLDALIVQCLNIIILSIIMLQAEIFDSAGYQKFVTQADGSMDLLMQLSGLKAKSITYIFNNQKVRKVVSIQRQKETIMQTVEKFKDKLKRWRKFTRTSLGDENLKKRLEKEYAEKLEKAKEEQLEKGKEEELDSKEGLMEITGDNAKQPKLKNEKSVKFEEGDDEKMGVVKKNKILKQEEKEQIISVLTKEFVSAKKQKLRCCASTYNWLNQTFTEQIIFKNRKEHLEGLTQIFAKGEVYVPTELETVMRTEAEFLIRGHFDNIDGNRELSHLFNRKKGKDVSNLLELTNIDKKIKLNQMRVTWNFTRTWPLFQRLIETFFHIIISQTQNLIYASMVFSMYQNAGLISVFYPIMAFGWGLVNETRPKKEFWRIIRLYTTFLLLAKFIFNMAIMEDLIKSDTYTVIQGYGKLGFFDYPDIFDMLKYMSPEILIISLIMLNEIKLKLCGIYFQIEGELETVQEAIDRQMNQGDEDILRHNKLERANMCMTRYFEAIQVQKRNQEHTQTEMLNIALETAKFEKNNVPLEPEETQEITDEHNAKIQISKAMQLDYFEKITKKVFQTSKEFDIDQNASSKDSVFDAMVSNNVILKSLESDSLVYVEGARLEYQSEFVSAEQIDIDMYKPENWDSWSNCDFPQQAEQRNEEQEKRIAPRPGYFEKSAYIESIFPSLKIQKPGKDYYGWTTTVLLLWVGYVFVTFKNFTVDPKSFVGGETSIFNSEMALTLVVLILITMIERIASRTDTKKATKKVDSGSIEGDSSFFNEQEMFKKTSTARSMTVAVKTMKTGDIDMQSDSAQQFLQSMQNGENGQASMDNTRTKITIQQKLKFILHWFMIIFGHLYIFWYIPISGNLVLYDKPNCNRELQKYYGCKNFHDNRALKGLYFFLVMYMCLSAIQLSNGFPIMRKPSAVLSWEHDPFGKLGADIFAAAPFLIELRCLIDFTFHKTSLDMFQTMALYMYHYELFASKIGNSYYNMKPLGSAVTLDEKCLFGGLVTTIILILIIGPLILFSNLMPGLVTFNPVISADVQISLNLNKTIYSYSNGQVISQELIKNMDLDEFAEGYANGTIISTTQSTPYLVYDNENPFFRVYNEKQWEISNYTNWTETNFMKPEQVQRMQANDFSDTKWDITDDNRLNFLINLNDTVNKEQNFTNADTEPILQSNFSLMFDFAFDREQPAEAKTTHYKVERKMNYTKQTDCLTGIQIQNIIKRQVTQQQCLDDPSLSSMVMFRQTYMPNLVLGKTDTVHAIDRANANDNENEQFTEEQKDAKRKAMQMHDVALVFRHCSQTWGVYAKLDPTKYSEKEQNRWHVTDMQSCAFEGEVLEEGVAKGQQISCEPGRNIWLGSPTDDGATLNFTKPHDHFKSQAEQTLCTPDFFTQYSGDGSQNNLMCYCEGEMDINERLEKYHRENGRDFHQDGWGRLHVTLFSLMVSASFLATYSPYTFFMGIAYVAGGQFRINLIINTFMAMLYEITESKGLIKLFEAVYIHRHEQNLREEEEVYRMIVEIYRSPELFKALTGSTLKGDCDPKLDKMDPKTKEKLLHLEKLEAKGFDVEELKVRLLAQRPDEEKDDSEKQA